MERCETGKKGESGPETLPDSTAGCPDGRDQEESGSDGENSAIISDED